MVLTALLNLPLISVEAFDWAAASFRGVPGYPRCVRALDKFSFPSGHTLHAVAFAVVFSWHFPLYGVALIPMVVLIAVSRVALGLHYPSDVAAGAAIGALVGLSVVLMY